MHESVSESWTAMQVPSYYGAANPWTCMSSNLRCWTTGRLAGFASRSRVSGPYQLRVPAAGRARSARLASPREQDSAKGPPSAWRSSLLEDGNGLAPRRLRPGRVQATVAVQRGHPLDASPPVAVVIILRFVQNGQFAGARCW